MNKTEDCENQCCSAATDVCLIAVCELYYESPTLSPDIAMVDHLLLFTSFAHVNVKCQFI